MAETEAPVSSESRRQQRLPRPAATAPAAGSTLSPLHFSSGSGTPKSQALGPKGARGQSAPEEPHLNSPARKRRVGGPPTNRQAPAGRQRADESVSKLLRDNYLRGGSAGTSPGGCSTGLKGKKTSKISVLEMSFLVFFCMAYG